MVYAIRILNQHTIKACAHFKTEPMRCPSIDESMKKMYYLYIMEFCVVIKKKMKSAVKWIKLKIVK